MDIENVKRNGIKIYFIAIAAFYCFLSATVYAASGSSRDLEHTVDELPYGVALYDFFQGNHFSSITDILVAKKNQTIVDENKTAELLLGSMYLSYGLQARAHKIFNEIILNEAQDIPQNILDQAWFHMGKDYYTSGLEEKSSQALMVIGGSQKSTLGPEYESERLNILSQLYMHKHQYEDAIKMLELFPEDSAWKEYTQFNLGVSLIKNDRSDEGMVFLESVANSRSSGKELGILHDQANLALAAAHALSGKLDSSIKHFETIKLRNPQSNSALLGLGWVKLKKASYKDALWAWLEVSQGIRSDIDVQEALMLIPYALEKSGDKVNALNQYDFAVDTYAQQLRNVEEVRLLIQKGEVARVLKLGAISENSFDSHEVIKMMGPALSDYLFDLMISSEFKHIVNGYRELAVLQKSLTRWQKTIPFMNLILKEKIKTYNNRLSGVVKSFKFENVSKLKNKRTALVEKFEKVLASDPESVLASKEEKENINMLDKIKTGLDQLGSNGSEVSELKDKHRFLSGLLKWNIDTDYAPRLWVAKKSITELDSALEMTDRAVESLTTVWKLAPGEHKKFREKIKGKNERIKALKIKVKQAMFVQEKKVQVMAEKSIDQYREYLKKYHDRALYGKARVYDSMVKKN
jgi:tetratricopeptide (TPR) repeat protein